MMNFEQHGFAKLVWQGSTPDPMPIPNVPYWAVRKPHWPYVETVIWVPSYDSKGNSGFMNIEDFDICLLEDNKWTWDPSVFNPYEIWRVRPHVDYEWIKRIPSPLPEEFLVIPDFPSVLA